MGMLTFSNDPPKIYVIPRLEDNLIDLLFYQEDEIGEMRHTAFMIECGLEEDPPDGPDVPPIPWKFTPGAPQPIVKETPKTPQPASPVKPPRHPPTRTVSMDDAEDLEEELPSPTRERRERPTRTGKIFASRTKSGTFHGMVKKQMPDKEKSHSADSIEDKKVEPPQRPKRLVAAKSGSLHGMRDAARKAKEEEDVASPRSSPLRRSKLVVTKSGTLHGMRKAVEKAAAEDAPKVPHRASKLVATKSGALHGMREAAKKAVADSIEEESKPLRRKLKSTSSDKSDAKDGPLKSPRKSDAKDGPPKSPRKSDAKDGPPKSPRRSLRGDDSENSSPIKGIKKNGSEKSSPDKSSKTKSTVKKISTSDTSDSDSLSGDFGRKSDSDVASDVSLDTDEDVPKSPVKRTSWWSEAEKGAAAKDEEKEEPQPERKRVFRNGKLVFDDGDSSPTKASPNPALERLRNGSRPKTMPTKNASIAHIGIPPAFQNSGVPPAFQASSSTRARPTPGKLKIPSKAKSVSAIDVPPAFRTSTGK